MKQIYTLTNDYLFKKIFTKEKYLKILLLDLFGVKANNIRYLNPELIKDNKVQKAGIIDILLEIDDEIVILELQNIDKHNFKDRLLYYSSAIIHNHCLRKSENYSKLQGLKVYAILNYNLTNKINCVVDLKEDDNKIFIEKLEYKIFDITKIDENDKRCKYYEIINLFKNDNLEKLKEIIKSKEYREILKQIENYNKNEEEYEKMEDIYKMWMEEEENYDAAYEDGITKGKTLGITQGEKNKTIDIAKNMLNKNIDINLISEITNMSIKDINAIK